MAWSFVLCEASGNPIGELDNAYDRRLRKALSRPWTLSCQIRHDHPLAYITRGLDTLRIKAYDNRTGSKVLRCILIPDTREKQRQDLTGKVALTATSPAGLLASRMIGRSQSGVSFGTALAPVTRASILTALIQAPLDGSSGAAVGDTGVRPGTITSASSTYAGPWRFKPISEAISEICNTLDGMDWTEAFSEPAPDGYGIKLCQLNASPIIGSVKPEAIFEFGEGKRNVQSWSEQLDATRMANDITHLPPGFPDNATQQAITVTDAASITARGRRETVVSADLSVDDLRDRLVREHLALRARPSQVIKPVPVRDRGQVPSLFVDYDVGDVVRFRAAERLPARDSAGVVTGHAKVTEVDALLRVYAADIDIDDEGNELVTPTLIDDRTAA